MLKLDGSGFSRGRSLFLDQLEAAPETTAKVYVKLRVADLEPTVYAQLDTGAAWSILDSTIIKALGALAWDGQQAKLDTRFGRKEGRLVKIPIALIAEQGESLEVNATFFVTADWPKGRNFLGYSGLLDSIRFALDPPKNHFYFGEA